MLDSGSSLVLFVINYFLFFSPVCSLILMEMHDNIYLFWYMFKNDKKYLVLFTNKYTFKQLLTICKYLLQYCTVMFNIWLWNRWSNSIKRYCSKFRYTIYIYEMLTVRNRINTHYLSIIKIEYRDSGTGIYIFCTVPFNFGKGTENIIWTTE